MPFGAPGNRPPNKEARPPEAVEAVEEAAGVVAGGSDRCRW